MAAVERKDLASRTSIFEFLVHFSMLRDPDTNRYYDARLVEEFDPDEMDRLLRLEHEMVFHNWLTCSLREQYADIQDFLSADEQHAAIFHGLREPATWQRLIPEAADSVERQLFTVDLCALMCLNNTGESTRAACGSLGLRYCLESGSAM